ncbi:MAG: nucleotidyl transferase AbiEii/AbiGii toxin family protein [Candidatus Omnitrophica bacterium]|nr:nucleotidyl transferase AbiEii/AbiGii toxin family protein [Candidatus Omnitrophota bacterium]
MAILTPLQERTLQAFFAVPECRRQFYLTGGTALAAFYLEHRISDDLDLFTHALELDSIERVIEDAWKQAGLRVKRERASPTFRRYRIEDDLQVDVVRDVDFRLGTPELRGAWMVDHPKNIAVNKVTAIYGRLEPKDYVDLYFLKGYLDFDILELLEWGRHKDAGLENFQWAKIIADVDTFTTLPTLLKPVSLAELKAFFHTLREHVLDALRPPR